MTMTESAATETDLKQSAAETVAPAAQPSRRPRWERPALAALLSVTAALYLWALRALGWGNEFYAAAVQAGTKSWKALLFGSLDAGNAITVDKPPASLWVMSLSGRVFGLNSWSMMVPQALMGVAAVALLYFAVRRTSGPVAALLSGTVLALTPVAALMFRYNNPDALLVLLLVAAAYCVVRALDPQGHSTRWVALSGVALGFAFLTKLLQAFLVVPALALVVLVAVPGSFWQRVRDLGVGLMMMLISGGWFVALVNVWPAASRPYIGGSTDNSLLQLALGYNGIGRVLGGEGNPNHGTPDLSGGLPASGGLGSGGPGGGGFGGGPGITRLFGDSMGTEISWLLPAALIGVLAGLWFTRRAERTDRTRAALLLWGGWIAVSAVVFSFMKGIMHPYYTIALAPGIAAAVGISVAELWRGKEFRSSRVVLGLMLATTGVWSFVLLDRSPDWLPWLRWMVLVVAIVVAAVLIAGGRLLGRFAATIAISGLLAGLAGTAAYTVETVRHGHSGPIPTSGPQQSDGAVGFGRNQPAPDVEQMLVDTDTRWAAATIGSHASGSLQLATGRPVMAIGGFSGGDNSPTLQQFQEYVRDGAVRYFIESTGPGGKGGPPGLGSGSGAGAQISEWVQSNFTFETVDGMTIYDLQR